MDFNTGVLLKAYSTDPALQDSGTASHITKTMHKSQGKIIYFAYLIANRNSSKDNGKRWENLPPSIVPGSINRVTAAPPCKVDEKNSVFCTVGTLKWE